jgi:hypothetical protein
MTTGILPLRDSISRDRSRAMFRPVEAMPRDVLAITSAFRCAVKRDRDSHAHRTAGASSSRSGSAGREGSSLCAGFRISVSGWRYSRWIDRTRCAGETGAAACRLPASCAACSERLVRRVIPRSGSRIRIAGHPLANAGMVPSHSAGTHQRRRGATTAHPADTANLCDSRGQQPSLRTRSASIRQAGGGMYPISAEIGRRSIDRIGMFHCPEDLRAGQFENCTHG